MQKIYFAAIFSLLAMPLYGQSNYLTITTGYGIKDASGTVLAGTFCAYATDSNDNSIAFLAGDGAQVPKGKVCRNVIAGNLATSLQLANPAVTNPQNINYHVTVTNTVTHQATEYPGVVIQTSGSSWDWSQWNPSTASIPVNIVTGPPGPQCSIGGGVCVMTVPIQLPADPVNPSYASTKNYTDTKLPLAGGTLTGPLTAPSVTVTTQLLAKDIEKVKYADQFTGATADVKINAAITALGGGGVVDLRGFGATTQTISSSVTLGTSAQQTIICDPSTVFVPGAIGTNMFIVNKGGHLKDCHVDVTGVSGYNGTILSFSDAYADGDNTSVEGFQVSGLGNTTGKAISLLATAGHPIVAVRFAHIRVYGMSRAIYISATGSGTAGSAFANGNEFHDVWVSDAVVALEMNATNGGDIEGNIFNGFQSQWNAHTVDGVLASGSTVNGSSVRNNTFSNSIIWDTTGSAFSFDFSNAVAFNNLFIGELTFGTITSGGTRFGVGNGYINPSQSAMQTLFSGPNIYNDESAATSFLNLGANYGLNNAVNGNDVLYDVAGVDGNSYDQMRLGFHYAGASSTSNYGWIGSTGLPSAFRFFDTGDFSVQNGRVIASGDFNNNNGTVVPSTATGNFGVSSGKVGIGQTCTTGSIGGGALAAGASASGTCALSASATGHPGFAAASDGTVQGNYTVQTTTNGTTATVTVTAITAGTPTAKTYNVTVF